MTEDEKKDLIKKYEDMAWVYCGLRDEIKKLTKKVELLTISPVAFLMQSMIIILLLLKGC